MSSQDQYDMDEEEDDDEDYDPAMARLLLSMLARRFQEQDQPDLEEELEFSETESEGAEGSDEQNTDVRNQKPDREMACKQLRHNISRRCDLFENTNRNIAHKLRMRSLGIKSYKGRRSALVSSFKPTFAKTIKEYSDAIFCGTFSQDGTTFMSACQDAVLRLYDTSQPCMPETRSFQARDFGWAIVDTCYSPDKSFLIYSSWSQYIHLITLDGERYEALDLQPGQMAHVCPFSIRFSQDSREIIAGTNQAQIYVYDCINDVRSLCFDAHDDDINAVCFLDKGSNLFVSGSDDALCKMWDRRLIGNHRNRPVATFRGHFQGITYLDAREDEQQFLSQSKDQSIKLWDIRHPSRLEAAPQIGHHDYRYFAFASNRTEGRRMRGDSSILTFKGHHIARTLIRAKFSPMMTTGQRYIYSGSADGHVYIYDIINGQTVQRLQSNDGICRDVAWHPFKPELLASGWDGRLVRHTFREGIST